MRAIRYFLINGLFAASIYFGFYEQHEGAYNIAMFVAWLTILCTLFLHTDASLKQLSIKGGFVAEPVCVAIDMLLVLAFIWFGALVTGFCYMISVAIKHSAWNKAKEIKTNEEI